MSVKRILWPAVSILVLAAIFVPAYYMRLSMQRTIFDSAVGNHDEKEVRKLLDSWPCPADPKGKDRCLFIRVAYWASKDLAVDLEKRGFDPLAVGDCGTTALHHVMGNLPMAEFLVEKGANVNARGLFDWTPLHSNGDSASVTRLLLKRGADVKARTSDTGSTPLHFAYGADVASALMAAGAEVDALNLIGRTPLHDAVKCAHLDVVRVLLDAGADVNLKDKKGRTPLSYARDLVGGTTRDDKKKQDLIDLLLQHGAKE